MLWCRRVSVTVLLFFLVVVDCCHHVSCCVFLVFCGVKRWPGSYGSKRTNGFPTSSGFFLKPDNGRKQESITVKQHGVKCPALLCLLLLLLPLL